MSNLFRNSKQKLYIFFGLLFVALSAISILAPTRHVYAANTITQPLVWTSADHTNLVDAKNHVFNSAGWFCGQVGNTAIFSGSGANITISDSAKPLSKTVKVPADTEAGSSAKETSVPACLNGNNDLIPANYAWVSTFSSGTNYALWVSGVSPAKIDAQHKPVNKDIGLSTYARLDTIQSGSSKAGPVIKVIKVDTSKAKLVNPDNGNADTKDTCLIQSWAFKWAACPILEYIVGNSGNNTTGDHGILGYMQAKMITWLVGDADTFNTAKGKSGASYYAAWSSFRNIAVSLIIIAGIVMVVAQAIGSSVIDAYTVRKIAPRLIAFAIIMTLSWWELKWLYQFFDNLTVWIASIISAPFDNTLKGEAPLDGTAMFSSAVLVLIGVASINPPIVFTYVLTFLTAVFVAWLILALRQMLLIFLLILSPIGISASILPGTKKVGDFWWNSTVTLLAMGPAIGIAIVFGQIIPKVFVTPQNADKFDKFGVIRLGAPFLGYLSTAFIAARLGGLAGTLTGMANDKAKGVFDRVSNKRGEMRSKRLNDMAKGQAWSNDRFLGIKGTDKIGKGLNKFTRGVATAGSVAANKPSAFLRKSSYQNGGIFSSSADQATRAHADEIQKDARWNRIKNNDGALRAATYSDDHTALAEMTRHYQAQHADWSADRARQAAQQDIQALHASGLERSAGLQYAAAIGMATTGTAVDDYMDQAAIISRVAGGNNAKLSALSGDMNFSDKMGKRHGDLAAGYGNVRESAAGYASYQRNLAIANSASASQDERRSARAEVTRYEDMINDHGVAASRGTSIHELSGDKSATFQNTARVLNRAMERHLATLDDPHASQAALNHASEQLGNLAAQMSNMKSSVPMFAAASNTAAMHDYGLRSADQNLQRVTNMTQQTVQVRQEIKDPTSGKVVGATYVPQANDRYNPIVAQTIQGQMSRRADPLDQDNYTQAS